MVQAIWPRRPVDTGFVAGLALLLATVLPLAPAAAQSVEQLRQLSLEDLGKIEVTSVSLRPQPLSEAPAAIYVITHDDIVRSGAVTLPEILRLAPNLEVARINSQDYAISARGFNSVNASDKLLVLIDGRSIYTPFFSSVFWDQQQVMPDNIERIEVISGPGGTLWGSNAVNGVINIITRNSADTQGGLADLTYGSFNRIGSVRWGGKFDGGGTYRVYGLGFGEGNTDLPDRSTSAMDDWNGGQFGFRGDLGLWGGAALVEGTFYDNSIDFFPGSFNSGANVSGRWTRRIDAENTVQAQAYYDRQERQATALTGSSNYLVDTFDARVQHNYRPGARQQIVWGFGERVWGDHFVNTINPFVLIPQSDTISLSNLFGQDTIAITPALKLTLGSKFEYSSFSGFEVMPGVRLGWLATPGNFFWAAISRSVKTPSRLDRDLQAPGVVLPATDLESEKLIAYELGWRAQLLPSASVSTNLFFNHYDDLRTTSLSPTGGLPAMFANGMQGDTYGAEIWGDWRPLRWLRLVPGMSLLRKDLHLKPGATDIAGIQTSAGHDPGHQFFLRAYIDLPHHVELYADARQIGALSDIGVPAYFEADVRVSWHVTPRLEVSLAGLNLVHAHHAETITPPVLEIPRSVYARLRISF